MAFEKKIFIFIGFLLIVSIFSISVVSAGSFGYDYLNHEEEINYSNIVINETSNQTEYWNTNEGTLDDVNSTQFENNGGTLNIINSWLTSLFYTQDEVDTELEDYVPYTGATDNINIGDNNITTDEQLISDTLNLNNDNQHKITYETEGSFDDLKGINFGSKESNGDTTDSSASMFFETEGSVGSLYLEGRGTSQYHTVTRDNLGGLALRLMQVNAQNPDTDTEPTLLAKFGLRGQYFEQDDADVDMFGMITKDIEQVRWYNKFDFAVGKYATFVNPRQEDIIDTARSSSNRGLHIIDDGLTTHNGGNAIIDGYVQSEDSVSVRDNGDQRFRGAYGSLGGFLDISDDSNTVQARIRSYDVDGVQAFFDAGDVEVNNGDVRVSGNVTASDFITNSKVADVNKGQEKGLDKLNNIKDWKDDKGNINYKNHYAHQRYNVSKQVGTRNETKEREVCEPIYEEVCEYDEIEEKEICYDKEVDEECRIEEYQEEVPVYEEFEKEGLSMETRVAEMEKMIWELKNKNEDLEKENEEMKNRLDKVEDIIYNTNGTYIDTTKQKETKPWWEFWK
ncbi:MAG: hypothetical protein ACOC56_02995 [Atribacterota bacterium]